MVDELLDLLADGPVHLSDILDATKMTTQDAVSCLALLALQGKVYELPGNRYEIMYEVDGG